MRHGLWRLIHLSRCKDTKKSATSKRFADFFVVLSPKRWNHVYRQHKFRHSQSRLNATHWRDAGTSVAWILQPQIGLLQVGNNLLIHLSLRSTFCGSRRIYVVGSQQRHVSNYATTCMVSRLRPREVLAKVSFDLWSEKLGGVISNQSWSSAKSQILGILCEREMSYLCTRKNVLSVFFK